MDEQKDPVDILDEIMSRSEKPFPSPVSYPPRFDPPSPEDIPPPAPEEKKPTPAERLLPWLGALLGGAVLAALVLGFQLFSVNARLDGLQAAVGEIRAVDELQKEVDDLENQLKQAEDAAQKTDQRLWDDGLQISDLSRQKHELDYLWHIGQFMEREDYPMAAVAAAYSTPITGNPMQKEQYTDYLAELEERGYLERPSPYTVEFSATWDPSKNPYMAALGILWCALDQYYVQGNPGNAAGILYVYQSDTLGNEFPGSIPYPPWLRNSASEYVLALYDGLRADLAAQDYLVVEEDGTLKCGPALYAATDANGEGIRVNLPFVLPGHSELPEGDIKLSIPE